MKNLIIVIIGAILVFVVITKLNPKPADPVVENPDIEQPTELKLTSTKGVEIFITMPKEGEAITSPLTVKGRAPGNWFFEANAGLVLTDWDGLIIKQGYVMADGEWMTTDYVPFTGTLEFVKPAYGERGTLIFQKDNPSGEPQFDDAAEMTINFK
jgi:hypothetical protein